MKPETTRRPYAFRQTWGYDRQTDRQICEAPRATPKRDDLREALRKAGFPVPKEKSNER